MWRPLDHPVERSPLAHVDVSTVRPEDWKKVKILYGDRVGRIQGLAYSPRYRWYWIERMTPDQVWIFCQFDNKRRLCVPHSAVDMVGQRQDAKPRKSIESRCMIRYNC